jgi:hypothetical protein
MPRSLLCGVQCKTNNTRSLIPISLKRCAILRVTVTVSYSIIVLRNIRSSCINDAFRYWDESLQISTILNVVHPHHFVRRTDQLILRISVFTYSYIISLFLCPLEYDQDTEKQFFWRDGYPRYSTSIAITGVYAECLLFKSHWTATVHPQFRFYSEE